MPKYITVMFGPCDETQHSDTTCTY